MAPGPCLLAYLAALLRERQGGGACVAPGADFRAGLGQPQGAGVVDAHFDARHFDLFFDVDVFAAVLAAGG